MADRVSLATLALAKAYADQAVEGAGAIKGKNCEIQSIEPIEGGNRVTFAWYDEEQVLQTTILDVMNGEDSKPAVLYTATLLASGWDANKTQTIEIVGLSTDDNGTIGLLDTATATQIREARKAIITVTNVSNDSITFACEQIPTIDIPFGIVISGGGDGVTVVANPTGEATANLTKLQVGTTIYEISGGGGSAELTSDLTCAVTVGGIAVGTEYETGTPLEDIIADMLSPVLYPTLTNPSATLTGTGNKLLETGATLAVTLTASFNRGSINPAYGTSGYRAGVATGYTLNGGTSQAENTWNETVSASNRTFTASVAYAAGEQPKDSKGGNYSTPLPAGSVNTGTVSYDFVDAMWANTASIATIAKLSLVAKSTKQRDLTFPAQTVANPEVFDMPASWTVTAVQVKNDLSGQWEDASSQFTITDTTHDNAAGTSVNYKRYTFNMGVDTGSRQIRVKWS